jgi:hypothetical protein
MIMLDYSIGAAGQRKGKSGVDNLLIFPADKVARASVNPRLPQPYNYEIAGHNCKAMVGRRIRLSSAIPLSTTSRQSAASKDDASTTEYAAAQLLGPEGVAEILDAAVAENRHH